MAFSYYRSITYDHTKCGTADTSSYPMAVVLSDTTLKSAGNGGHVQSSNGYDIYFYSDSGLTTRIAAERERYNATTGEYIGWVNIATLSHTADGTIYMAYGDSSISSDPNSDATYGKNAVWDTNFKGVWHFPDGTTLTANDSTSNGYNGTLTGMSAGAGTIDGAAVSAGGTDQVDVATFANFTRPGTFEFILTATAVRNKTIMQASSYPNNFIIYTRNITTAGEVSLYVSGTDEFSADNIADGTKHYVGFVVDSSGNRSIYVDGSAATVQNISGTVTAFTTTTHIDFFNGLGAQAGTYDEFRISNTNRSASYFTASHNNESSPGNIGSPGFYTVGSETSTGGAVVHLFQLLGVGV